MCSGELKIVRLSNDQPARTEGVFITVITLENPKFDLQTDIMNHANHAAVLTVYYNEPSLVEIRIPVHFTLKLHTLKCSKQIIIVSFT